MLKNIPPKKSNVIQYNIGLRPKGLWIPKVGLGIGQMRLTILLLKHEETKLFVYLNVLQYISWLLSELVL